MLTLMLLRHAKAVGHKGEDFRRGLTEKGAADAARIGRRMADLDLLPDIAFVSAADRTRETFELFERASGRVIDARYEESLYNATDTEMRDVLLAVDPQIATLMLVGHNPGIMDVAALLARDGDRAEIDRLQSRFPPGALAVISFGTDDWRDARVAGGRLDLLLFPEDLETSG